MATKKARKSVSEYLSVEKSSGHSLSPTLSSRLEEKFQLQKLNDRLATYIDRVHVLETDNKRLSHEVQSSKETTIESLYDQELADVRKVLDDTAREKARLQIECAKWKTNCDEVKEKLSKKEKDYDVMQQKVVKISVENENFQNQVKLITAEKEHLEKVKKGYEDEKAKLCVQLNQFKNKLEEDTLSRIDLLNRLQSAKEDLSFKTSFYEKTLSELRAKKQTEISDIDSSCKQQYEENLADALKQIREKYESQLQQNKDNIESFYEEKLLKLQFECDQHAEEVTKNEEKLRNLKKEVEFLTSKLQDMENKCKSASGRAKALEELLEQERNWHKSALDIKEQELKSLKDMIDCQLKDYQDLLEIKTALDMEIAAYRKLLESEESRLNITPKDMSVSEISSTSPKRIHMRAKRKFTAMQDKEQSLQSSATAVGDIEINDEDSEGQYIKLFNKGNKDIPMRGWKIVRKAGDQETSYKFHQNSIIKANSYCTVWSSDVGTTHNPPTDLILKGHKWCTAKSMSTVLLNYNGEEIASRETSLKKLHKDLDFSIPSSSFQATEELYHQQGDPGSLPDHCLVM